MKIAVLISRILVGVLFIISGLIKLNDPIGFGFKLEEYFGPTVLDLPFLMPYALGISIFVVVLEVLLGVFLIIGYKPKFTVWSLLGMIVFFTFLTFYSAYYDKVKDCGCFGDALKLTPWESFTKDAILLALILILFFGVQHIKPIFGKFTITLISLLSFIGCLAFGYHVLMHLPSVDFRAYKIGDNLIDNMTVPEDAPKTLVEYKYFFDVNGEEKSYVVTSGYPDVEGTFLRVESKILEEGYEAPIHDFSIERDGEDYTQTILQEEHLIMVVAYDMDKSEKEGLKAIKEATDLAIEKGYKVVGLTATGPEDQAVYKEAYKLNFDFYFCDGTALKTIVRSNPGILKLEKGTVIQKFHFNDVKDLELPRVERPEPVQTKTTALYFIDDVLSVKAEADALDPETIETVNIITDSLSLLEYKERAVDSLVKIILKK